MKGYSHLLLITSLFLSCSENNRTSSDENSLPIGDSLTCTAEDTMHVKHHSKPVFVEGGYEFMYGEQVTDEVAYSGKRSIKLDPVHRFGMEVTIPGAKVDDVFKVTVMRKGTAGNIAMKCPTVDKEYFQFGGEIVETFDDGWQRMELFVKVPPHLKGDKIKFYLQYFEKGVTYFDDFTVKRVTHIEYPKFDGPAINIYLQEEEYNKLKVYREVSFIRNVIPREVKEYVDGFIAYKSDTVKGKVRLKGEWLDHLEGDKWSFRIKMKGNGYNGMNKFSIHTPLARNYLKEFVAHKLFQEENLLASKYDFIPVSLNDKSLGLYAIEEYFDEKFVQRNNRRGIVLRWDEEGFWNAQKMSGNKVDHAFGHPMYQASFVSTFSFDKVLKDKEQLQWYKEGSKLLYDYRDDKIDLEEAFCLGQLAKYTALVDICGTFHGATWHNIRYFYNADSAKLEPILFDGYSDGDRDAFVWYSRKFIGDLTLDKFSGSYNDYQQTKIFNNKKFREKYLMYVNKFSDRAYLDKFLEKYVAEIKGYEKQIQKEFTSYEFDDELLKVRSSRLLRIINRNSAVYNNYNLPTKVYRHSGCNYPIVQPYTVHAYTQDDNGIHKQLKLLNNYCEVIEVYLNKKWVPLSPQGGEAIVIVSSDEENFQMRVKGTSKIYNLEVLPYMRE